MSGLSNARFTYEEARIRQAYAKRSDGLRYSGFDAGHLYAMQGLERQFLVLLKQHGFAPLDAKNVLEVGCGTGFWLRELIKWGAKPENISGVELQPECVTEAQRLCPGAVKIECENAVKLSFPDETFDLVFQFTVFTSILAPDMKQQVASEMLRVAKEDGLILWYDFHVNNPWNPDVRAVKKQEIQKLFLGCRIEMRRITLAPPIARLIAPYSWMACYLLEKIPLLCTHYLGVIQKGYADA